MPRPLNALHGTERRNPNLDRVPWSALSQELQGVANGERELRLARLATKRGGKCGFAVKIGNPCACHPTILAR